MENTHPSLKCKKDSPKVIIIKTNPHDQGERATCGCLKIKVSSHSRCHPSWRTSHSLDSNNHTEAGNSSRGLNPHQGVMNEPLPSPPQADPRFPLRRLQLAPALMFDGAVLKTQQSLEKKKRKTVNNAHRGAIVRGNNLKRPVPEEKQYWNRKQIRTHFLSRV